MTRRQLVARAVAGAIASTLLPSAATASVSGAATNEVAPGLSIRPRAAWAGGDRPPTGSLSPEEVRFLLVHHTASPNGSDPITTMRGAYDFHTGPERGWPDVAYNFFIDQFGVVWEGRAGSLRGPVEADATGGSQGFAQLVCLLGDFTSVLPTPAALASLARTLAWLGRRDGVDTAPGATTTFTSRGSNRWPAQTSVDTATIAGHRDMSRTACPGDAFYPTLVEQVPSAVEAIRTSWAETADASTTTSTTTTVPATAVAATDGTTTVANRPAATAPATTALTGINTGTTQAATSTTAAASSDGSNVDDSSMLLAAIGLGGVAVAGAGLWYTARRSEAPRAARNEPPPAD